MSDKIIPEGTELLVRRLGWLDWEAKLHVAARPGRTSGTVLEFGMTRDGAIRKVIDRFHRMHQPWERVA